MNLRTVLLAGVLALAAATLRAEELQFTISGVADCPSTSFCSGQPTTGPATITFDLNTSSATLTPTFANNPVGGPPGEDLVNLAVSFPLTNYSAIVGGHTIGFAASGSGSFRCEGFPVGPTNYECGLGTFSPGHVPGTFTFDDNETWIPTLTEAQYKALQDPLASLLLSNTSPPGVACAFSRLECFMDEGPGTSVHFSSTFTVTPVPTTPVPTPAPLLLFLAGLLGLLLSRRREWPGFLLRSNHLAIPAPAWLAWDRG